MGVNAFVDNGFPPGCDFCSRFLSSPEFNIATLRQLVPSAPSHEKKEDIALRIAHALQRDELTPEKVLLAYVNQPRTWLSLKQGHCERTLKLAHPSLLLWEFAEEGWN